MDSVYEGIPVCFQPQPPASDNIRGVPNALRDPPANAVAIRPRLGLDPNIQCRARQRRGHSAMRFPSSTQCCRSAGSGEWKRQLVPTHEWRFRYPEGCVLLQTKRLPGICSVSIGSPRLREIAVQCLDSRMATAISMTWCKVQFGQAKVEKQILIA